MSWNRPTRKDDTEGLGKQSALHVRTCISGRACRVARGAPAYKAEAAHSGFLPNATLSLRASGSMPAPSENVAFAHRQLSRKYVAWSMWSCPFECHTLTRGGTTQDGWTTPFCQWMIWDFQPICRIEALTNATLAACFLAISK